MGIIRKFVTRIGNDIKVVKCRYFLMTKRKHDIICILCSFLQTLQTFIFHRDLIQSVSQQSQQKEELFVDLVHLSSLGSQYSKFRKT